MRKLRVFFFIIFQFLLQLHSVTQDPRDPAGRCRDKGVVVIARVREIQSYYATNCRRDQPKRFHLIVTGNVKSIVPGG